MVGEWRGCSLLETGEVLEEEEATGARDGNFGERAGGIGRCFTLK